MNSIFDVRRRAAGLAWEDHVVIDERFFRPAEVDLLVGDAEKATTLDWKPDGTFQQMIVDMVESDIDLVRRPSEM